MAKLKVLYIHSSKAFIRETKVLEDNININHIVVIGKKNSFSGLNNESIRYFKPNYIGIHKLISLCKNYDVIFLYDLNFIKCYIANRLPSNVKIIWRFFGLELYSRMPNDVFSSETIKIKKDPYKQLQNNVFKHLKRWMFFASDKKEFLNAIKRMDGFLGLSIYEYDFLKSKWPDLPPFIQCPFSHNNFVSIDKIEKNNQIITGNNKSPYNNHVDVIKIINECSIRNQYSFIMFFNSGIENKYTKAIRNKVSSIKEIKLFETYLPMDEIVGEYITSSAFVMNGYRQMAMFNVFHALIYGVKLYLNKKNIIYNWLVADGFLVYTIEDFKNDIESNNIKLTKDEMKYNRNQYINCSKKYSKEYYITECYRIIRN